jgi:hypothetical protein
MPAVFLPQTRARSAHDDQIMQFPHSRSLNIKTSSTSLTWREKDLQQRPQQGNLEDRVEITARVLAASSGESISSFEVVEMSSDPPTAILLGIDMYSLESALMVLLHRESLIAFTLALSLPRLHTYHHGGLLPPPHLNSPHLIRLSHPITSRRKMSGLGYEVRAGWSNPGMRNHPHVFRLVWNYLPTHHPWSADQSIPNQLSSENNTSSIELDITPVGRGTYVVYLAIPAFGGSFNISNALTEFYRRCPAAAVTLPQL